MSWDAIQQWLAGTRLVRRLTEALWRGRARRQLAYLDHLDAARCQAQTLRGLVHQAHTTRFGREHDFCRIRTPQDFRRLVPLRTPSDFWRDYWQPAFPDLAGTTWPGPIPTLAAGPSAAVPYLPAPPALWASHRAAVLSTLSFITHARPQTRLFKGSMLLVNEGPPPTLLAAGVRTGGAGWLGIQELPPRLRPLAFRAPVCGDPECTAEGRLRVLAERAAHAPLTLLAGDAEVLQKFFALCRAESGWPRTRDIWPALSTVVYQSRGESGARERLVEQVGSPPVLLLEACLRPEGALAVEDPRHGCMRLLPHHGVYFEFVPPEEATQSRPIRLGIGEIETGVPYAVAVSSPAGVWACLAGIRVSFERRDPPLLRLLQSEPVPTSDDRKELPLPLQPPHQRNGLGVVAQLGNRRRPEQALDGSDATARLDS